MRLKHAWTHANAHNARLSDMYAEEYLVRERHQEHARQAEEDRAARQVAELHKLQRRQERAKRQLLHAWQRVEQLRSLMSAG